MIARVSGNLETGFQFVVPGQEYSKLRILECWYRCAALMVSMLAPQFLHLSGSSEPLNIARSARLAGISSKQFSRKHVGLLMKTFTRECILAIQTNADNMPINSLRPAPPGIFHTGPVFLARRAE